MNPRPIWKLVYCHLTDITHAPRMEANRLMEVSKSDFKRSVSKSGEIILRCLLTDIQVVLL